MMIEAIGTLATPAKNPPMPTRTKALGWMTQPGASLCPRKPKAPPSMAPMNTDGPKTPPLPPELMVQEVAAILRKTRRSIVPQKIFPSSAIWTQPYPPSVIWGAKYAMAPSISPPSAGLTIRGIFRGMKNRSRAP